jgi:subtilase family serine protease
MRLRTLLVPAAIAAVGLAVTTAPAALTASPAAAHVASVRPVPAVIGHQLGRTLSFPPDTQYCLDNIGIHCYSVLQYRTAYDLDPLYAHGITGKGRTIAIVDSFGSPTALADLKVFDQTYGLPDPPSFKVIQPAGAVPAFDPNDGTMVGWAQETALDVEMAHAMAPDANILLVETPTAETEGVEGFPEIVKAENYVINHHLADVITQSFGASEGTFPSNASIFALRSAYLNAAVHGVTVLASSGDDGVTNFVADGSALYDTPMNSWPSSDPLVTSVGGTQLNLDATGNKITPDVVWNDGFGAGGGGVSQVFPRPLFQFGVRHITGPTRGTPDISLSAAVDGGVVVYYSFDPLHVGYHIFGGTSEASPLFSGIVALAAQKAHHSLGWLNPKLYALAPFGSFAGVVDVTSGDISFGGVTGPSATKGYDLASGWGTVDAARFVRVMG